MWIRHQTVQNRYSVRNNQRRLSSRDLILYLSHHRIHFILKLWIQAVRINVFELYLDETSYQFKFARLSKIAILWEITNAD